jgi:group I intron endonuclease
MSSGIYGIKNSVNGKIYVGSSTNLERRKTEHFDGFKKGKAVNKHLKYAVQKYGIDNFEFTILEECTELLLEREQHWWEIHKDHCYNCYKPNLDPWELSRILTGRQFDEEHCQNISKAMKKLIESGWVPWIKGRHHTEDSRQKMSNARKKAGRVTGNWSSEEAQDIRRRFMSGEMIMSISEDLDTHRKNIGSICNCHSYLEEEAFPEGYKKWFESVVDARMLGERPTKRGWKHSPEFIERFRKAVSGPKPNRRKLDEGQRAEIRERLANGESGSSLAREFSVSKQLISKIKRATC